MGPEEVRVSHAEGQMLRAVLLQAAALLKEIAPAAAACCGDVAHAFGHASVITVAPPPLPPGPSPPGPPPPRPGPPPPEPP